MHYRENLKIALWRDLIRDATGPIIYWASSVISTTMESLLSPWYHLGQVVVLTVLVWLIHHYLCDRSILADRSHICGQRSWVGFLYLAAFWPQQGYSDWYPLTAQTSQFWPWREKQPYASKWCSSIRLHPSIFIFSPHCPLIADMN